MKDKITWNCKAIPKLGFGLVYALSDPRNPRVPKYVGKTKRDLRRRVAGHFCFSGYENEGLKKWILELKSQRLVPTAYVLEEVQISKLSEREESWIKFFKPLGILANKSNGDGMRGLKGVVSLLNRQITAERNRSNRGKKLTEEHKAKLRGRMPTNTIPILCVETGEKFSSLTHAGKSLVFERHLIKRKIILGSKINGKTLIFT